MARRERERERECLGLLRLKRGFYHEELQPWPQKRDWIGRNTRESDILLLDNLQRPIVERVCET
jgi:hypothetical protein